MMLWIEGDPDVDIVNSISSLKGGTLCRASMRVE